MRDHWRDEDHRRDDSDRRDRQRQRSSDRPFSPVPLRQQERNVDSEVKIKGRASLEEIPSLSSRKHESYRDRDPLSHAQRRSSRSPQRRNLKEGPNELYREVSEERGHYNNDHQRRYRRHPDDRRRSRNRSPHRTSHSHRGRLRSPDPYHPRDSERDVDTKGRYKEARYSRPSSSHGAGHYPASREESHSLTGDFYIPSTRRRSRSPVRKSHRDVVPSRKRSPSPRISHRREARPPFEEDDLFYKHLPRRRDRTPHVDRQARAPSRDRYEQPPHARGSADISREPSKRPTKRLRPSRSPEARETHKRSRMHSTNRIQVHDSTSRPQSPPRPIPSFDSDSQTSGAYPVHGMRPSHGPSRPGPLQLNTQHPHSTSPQWTPTSSHHGSPHSASPYSHGRGGWPAQPQQYHGQPG